MNKEHSSSRIDQFSDSAFSILLLVFFLIMMGGLTYSVFNEALGGGLFSFSGVTGAGYGYMKWNVIRRAQINPSSVSEIGDLLNNSKEKSNES